MSESIQDKKETTKNGLNNNSDDMFVYPSLNTPNTEDVNTLHEPRSPNHTSSRRKSETKRGRRLESINEDSECFTSVFLNTSVSTMSPSTPFAGFQVPEATIVHNVRDRKGRRSVNLSVREAIPVLPPSVAVICLIFNIIIPGLGTIISGFVAFCLSQEEEMYDKMAVLCVNCFVGLAQMTTIVFLLIGWIWSIAWGCAIVGLSAKYESKRMQGELEVSTVIGND